MIRTPEQMQEYALNRAKSMREAISRSVKVGLPAEKVGGKVYGDGMTVIRVGAIHEYGRGNNPVRSFLRVPFNIKRKELAKAIEKQFDLVGDGLPVMTALGRIGAVATNISKDAFVSQGYGAWPELSAETIAEKGSSQILIDTGTLRNSITWVVQ